MSEQDKKALQKIKGYVIRAESFKSEGNYAQSSLYYQKVLSEFNNMLGHTHQKAHDILIHDKIKKYQEELAKVKKLEVKKVQRNSVGVTSFGFPAQNIHQPQNIVRAKQHEKNNSHGHRNTYNHIGAKVQVGPKIIKKEKFKIQSMDPDIEGMVVKNIKLGFKDVIGMEEIKQVIEEAVIRPRRRPDLYKGIRAPPRGILFYGPPGNGKTYMAKALANESGCIFFNVSAAAIMTKWVGESQKMLKKLFKAAEQFSPSIIFIDEIDSLLTARSQKENEASRRVKTEFLVLMDGMMSAKEGDVLLIGATNLPSELDLAVLRRFNKLIYIGLPDAVARQGMVVQNLKGLKYNLNEGDMEKLIKLLDGYCASQITDIVKEVAGIPLREISKSQFQTIEEAKIREINIKDFHTVLSKKKPLLSKKDLLKYKGDFI